MWILAFFLLVQNPNQVAPPPGIPLSGAYRLNGKIVVDQGEIPLVDVRLKDDRANVLQTVQSFANGTFHLDGVTLGRYSVEVADSRYKLATVQLWLREAEDTSGVIVIRLARNDSGKASSGTPDADGIDMAALELDASLPAAALDEFKRGVDALRNRSKDNPPDAHFRKAVELAPDFYEGNFQLGLELARQRKGPAAIQAMERAALLKPTSAAPLSVLGRLYVEAGQFQNGVNTLLKIGPLGSLSADDRYYLGLAFYRLDNTAAAQQQLELAISLAPNKNPAAYVQLSNALQRNGNSTAALKALEDYLRLFPNDPNHKAVEEGARKLRTAIQKNPE
jgi:hypothetical protein